MDADINEVAVRGLRGRVREVERERDRLQQEINNEFA